MLYDVDDVEFVELTSSDVVRHRLVADIIDAYGRYDAAQASRRPHPVTSSAPRTGPPVGPRNRERRGR